MIHCAAGARSARGKTILQSLGYTDVANTINVKVTEAALEAAETFKQKKIHNYCLYVFIFAYVFIAFADVIVPKHLVQLNMYVSQKVFPSGILKRN